MNTKTLYLIIIILGFIFPFLLTYIINKKNKILTKENFIYSYIFFIIFFFLFSKLMPIILQLNFNSIVSFHNSESLLKILIYIINGYSMFFGYLGGLIGILLFLRITKENKEKTLLLYSHNLLLMVSILKIGCFVNGCCVGINHIPIQLIESIICLITYITIYYFINRNYNLNKLLYSSILVFFIERFILYFFRINVINLYSIIVQLICLTIITICFINLKRSLKYGKK